MSQAMRLEIDETRSEFMALGAELASRLRRLRERFVAVVRCFVLACAGLLTFKALRAVAARLFVLTSGRDLLINGVFAVA